MDTTTTSLEPAPSRASPSEKAAEAIFSLTERAVLQVKDVIKQQGFEGYYLTVRVVPAGCSGLGYDLNLMKESKPSDLLWDQDGVKLCTDGLSVGYLKGTQIDYQVSATGAGFKFENPNAKSSCGCGTSFSA
jgi:iron-sulfur cluster assembly protein